jgi:hypothetical protein
MVVLLHPFTSPTESTKFRWRLAKVHAVVCEVLQPVAETCFFSLAWHSSDAIMHFPYCSTDSPSKPAKSHTTIASRSLLSTHWLAGDSLASHLGATLPPRWRLPPSLVRLYPKYWSTASLGALVAAKPSRPITSSVNPPKDHWNRDMRLVWHSPRHILEPLANQ